MEVLGRPVSERFEALYKDAENVLGRPIEATVLPHLQRGGLGGNSELLTDRLLVSVSDGLSDEVFEVALAHEILHGVLFVEGAPRLGVPVRLAAQQDDLRSIARELGSTVHDLAVDQRVKALGFPVERLHELTVAHLEQQFAATQDRAPEPFTVRDHGGRSLLVQLLLQATPTTRPRIHRMYAAKRKHMLAWAPPVVKRIRRIGVDTPDEIAECLLALLRSLRLEHMLVIIHPISCQPWQLRAGALRR